MSSSYHHLWFPVSLWLCENLLSIVTLTEKDSEPEFQAKQVREQMQAVVALFGYGYMGRIESLKLFQEVWGLEPVS